MKNKNIKVKKKTRKSPIKVVLPDNTLKQELLPKDDLAVVAVAHDVIEEAVSAMKVALVDVQEPTPNPDYMFPETKKTDHRYLIGLLVGAIILFIFGICIIFGSTGCFAHTIKYESPIVIPTPIATPKPNYPCTYLEYEQWERNTQNLKNIKQFTDEANIDCKSWPKPCHNRLTCTEKELKIGPYKDKCSDDLSALYFQRNLSEYYQSPSNKCLNAIKHGWIAPKR
jgi:hypothetical protein